MIREVIRPVQSDFHIKIPTEYLNKEVEFIMFPLDENNLIPKVENNSIKSLRGVFSKYADSSKIALEDKAWQMHIMDKFKKHD
jgi:hypothetical protein